MKSKAKILALLLAICATLGIFTACEESAVNTDTVDSKPLKSEITALPDEYPQLEAITGIPGYTPPSEPDEPDEPEKVARYAASSESNKYHRLSCHYVDRIKSYNIVYYYTESEAKKDGKKPCSVCSP